MTSSQIRIGIALLIAQVAILTMTLGFHSLLDRQAAQEMLDSLVADRFVDDARYAAAFARERSSLTGWGPDKIRYSLLMKGISKADIAAALEEVDPEAAGARMEKLITAKCKSLQGDPFIKFKLIKYALSRGYRYDDVAPAVDRILSSQD